MKKISFSMEQITTMVRLLNLVQVEGMQQAKLLCGVGQIIDMGKEEEETDETGEGDRNSKQNERAAV